MLRKLLKPFPRLYRFAASIQHAFKDLFAHPKPNSVASPDLVVDGGEPALPQFREGSAGSGNVQMAADGFPLPSAEMRHWVAGTSDAEWFMKGGELGKKTIVDMLGRQEISMDQMQDILDFGCGCGRVIRHLAPFTSSRLHGSDINPTAIIWCDQNLEFAEFGSNRMEPPMRYRDESFDLIYAFSVFTHLSTKMQDAWMREMHRLLRPGGYLLVTLHGDYHTSDLSAEQKEAYRNGQMVVVGDEREGHNFCASFHPEKYVREKFSKGFSVLQYVPEGALGNPRQDAYLLQKLAG